MPVLLNCPSARAADFYVAPIRLYLDSQARTGAITVTNDAPEPLNVQVQAFKWTQDPSGKDVYTETKNIIYFPRIATVDGKGQRIIRAGVQVPAASVEKTYRIFIGEIPARHTNEKNAQINVAIRFGVPIFVKPVQEKPSAALGSLGIYNGVLEVPVRNTGNVHFIIKTISVKGKNARGEAVFSKDVSGWYLLAGASRLYSVPIDNSKCRDLARLDIAVTTDRPDVDLSGSLEVNKKMCGPTGQK